MHGLYLDGRAFDYQAEALQDRYRTLLADVRDHGRSGSPPIAWNVWDAARELCTAIEELDHGPVHWVGLSMGGMIGLRAALTRPELVRSLVLVDTSADAEERALLHKTMARFVGTVGRPAARLLMPYVARKMFSAEGREDPEAEVWTERVVAVDPDALVRASMAVFDREPILDRLGEIDVPSLVIVGEEDAATGVHQAKLLAEGLPDAELVRIPGAGHLTPIETPEAVTEAIEAFLRHATAQTATTQP